MNKEIRGLHEAAYVLALFTFLSQILALFRDRVFAHVFGAGAALDAYFAAFRIPDLSFAVLTLFVSSFALVPLITERGGAHTEASRRLLGSAVFTFGLMSILSSAILFFIIPDAMKLLFPGFAETTHLSAITLSRIMLLQPILLGFSAILSSIIQVSRRFLLYALAPIFYNFGIIFGALFLYPSLGIEGLAWGVVTGALLHVLIQAVPLIQGKAHIGLIVTLDWFKESWRVATLSLPRSLALSAHQVLLVLFASAASLSSTGSVSVVSFAWNLQSVPLAIVGVSYASALFPSLAALFAKGEREVFVRETWAAIRHIMLWIALAIALMVVLRAHIVRVILGTGAFTWADTRLTAAVLAGFAISLVAQSVLLVFSRAYYAAGRSLEPIIINVGASLVAGALAYASVVWFQHASLTRFFFEDLFRITGIPGTEVAILALSYSSVMLVFAALFGVLFAQRFGFEKRTLKSFLFSFAAAVISGAACYATLQLFGPLLPTETFLGIFAQGVAGGMAGIFAWAATLTLLRSREFEEVFAVFFRLVTPRTNL